MTFVVLWWFISAHKWFKGPVINTEHAALGSDGTILEGIGLDSTHLTGRDAYSKKAEARGAPTPEHDDIESL